MAWQSAPNAAPRRKRERSSARSAARSFSVACGVERTPGTGVGKTHSRRATTRASVFIATSLDGFIARENGDLDWLPAPTAGDPEDYGYAAFMRRIDALVMGRMTFDKVQTFGEWPYGRKPVFVLTHRPLKLPKGAEGSVEALAGSPARIVSVLEKRGLRRLYIDGGKTITAFLGAGLIDEIVITRVPVILGKGVPLFGPVGRPRALKHIGTRRFKSGLVQSRYEVRRGIRRRPGRK